MRENTQSTYIAHDSRKRHECCPNSLLVTLQDGPATLSTGQSGKVDFYPSSQQAGTEMTQATASDQRTTPDYTAIKSKQRATWGSGDYGRIGVTLQLTGEQLCETMDIRAGSSVLDVASGNGNAALAAARRNCKVVATDYVPALLDLSAMRADAEGLPIEYQQADAEALPFEDESFDNVVSTFGVMFTPNQALAASELLRVCKRGAKIGMANWTPDGFIGQLFATIGRHVPPPAGVASPAAWGTEAFLQTHFGPHATDIQSKSRWFAFRYESAAHWLDVFATYYGPMLKAFEAAEAKQREALRADIIELAESFNRADDGTLVIPSSYAEIVVIK